jgi:uncharacterized membrane protein YvbJ
MKTNKKPRREIFECPNCGADVPVGAKACKECGSDESTGWQSAEQKDYAQVDLPDGYREGESDELPPTKTAPWVRWTALVVAAAMIAGLLSLVL